MGKFWGELINCPKYHLRGELFNITLMRKCAWIDSKFYELGRNYLMGRLIYMFILLSILTLAGCSTKTPDSTSVAAPSKDSSSVAPSKMEARAIGTTSSGEVLIIPKKLEKIEQLGAPSCLGQAEDYSFKSDYEVTFKYNNGKISLITLPKIDTIISPENKQIVLPTFTFQGFQAVVITPQYTDCHGIAFYLIGTNDNVAFSFKFVTDDGTFNSFNFASNTKLKVVNDQLVVNPGQAAGSETKKQLTFKPDFKNQTMQLVKS
jgi:hypothetical protein